jgi:hypothetical protein
MAKVTPVTASPATGKIHHQDKQSERFNQVETVLGKYGNLQVSVVELDGELARKWLASNPDGNRQPSKATVHAYARDIAEDSWLTTGDMVRFNAHGKMMDGQHRCLGLIRANEQLKGKGLAAKVLTTFVLRGLPDKVMRVLDHGRKRAIGDQITIEGKRFGMITGAAARWLYTFKYGPSTMGRGRITASEIMEMVDNHPKLEESAGLCYRSRIGLAPALLTAIHYVAANLLRQPELAEEFATASIEGKTFYEGDAAFALRERMIRKRENRTRMGPEEMMKLAIHAWNLFSDRQPIARLITPDVVTFRGLDYKKL